MLKSIKRNTTSIKFHGWILPPTEAMPLGKSLISLNAPRWYRSPTSIRELKSLFGHLRAMMRRTKSFLIEIFSLKVALLKWKSWMFDDAWGDLDWISEEKYNQLKEKYNNMPKKKKKAKKKKKKAKVKKKKKR